MTTVCHKLNLLKVNDIAVVEAMVLTLYTSPGFGRILVIVTSSQIDFNILDSSSFTLKMIFLL